MPLMLALILITIMMMMMLNILCVRTTWMVHSPALAIYEHLLFPAGSVNRLQLMSPVGCLYHSRKKRFHCMCITAEFVSALIFVVASHWCPRWCIAAEFFSALTFVYAYHSGVRLRSDLCGCLTLVPEVVYRSGVLLRSDLCVCHFICGRGGVSQRSTSPL
jgi:hypothetical protein